MKALFKAFIVFIAIIDLIALGFYIDSKFNNPGYKSISLTDIKHLCIVNICLFIAWVFFVITKRINRAN